MTAPDATAKPFEVFNTETDECHGTYETLDQARGCVKFDRLVAFEIWRGSVRVECCDPEADAAYGAAEREQRQIDNDGERGALDPHGPWGAP
jgi:hypothetical protein